MTPDQHCYAFIRSREGLSLSAYTDSAGIWTIGYGTIMYENHTPVKQGDTITQAQAEQQLEWQVNEKAVAVAAAVSPAVINQNQFDALVSFAYNAGINALLGSTLLKLVKANPADPNIRNAFMMWDKAHVNGQLVIVAGLESTRTAEADLYFSTAAATA